MVKLNGLRCVLMVGVTIALTGCPDVDKYAEAPEVVDMALDAGQAQDADPTPIDLGESVDAQADGGVEPDLGPATDGAMDADGGSATDGMAAMGDADATDMMAGNPDASDIPSECTVTFSVGLPENTPDGDIYIAGEGLSDQAWETAVPEQRMERMGGEASLSWQAGHLSRITYKYTRGSWETGETTAGCQDIANRAIVVDCANAPMIVADQVLGWADSCQ